MVDWRAWPKETIRVADLSSRPEWARSPELRRELRADMLFACRTMIVLIVVWAVPIFGLLHLYAPDGTGPVAATIGLGGVFAMFGSLTALAWWGEEWTARTRVNRALDSLKQAGEVTLGGETVGVVYSDGYWRDAFHGDSWDWGVLRLDLDRLSFAGRFSRFDLRPEQVTGIEIKRCRSMEETLRGSTSPGATVNSHRR